MGMPTSTHGRLGRTAPRRFALLFAPVAVFALFAAPAHATNGEADGVAPEVALPTPLSDADATLYRMVFALQEEGEVAEADTVLERIGDKLLVGHLKLHRQRMVDGPAAANRRRALGGGAKDGPAAAELHQAWRPIEGFGHLNGADRAAAKAAVDRFARLRRAGSTKATRQLLEDSRTLSLFKPVDQGRLMAAQAFAYFVDGEDALATEWAERAAAAAPDSVPLANWTAGLVAFRAEDWAKALEEFSAMAKARTASPWQAAAGAYWASRVSLRARRPHLTASFLEEAAQHRLTFYGILARRALGRPLVLRWEEPRLTAAGAEALMKSAAGRRALALVQVGRGEFAEPELRSLFPARGRDLAEAVAAVSERANVAALALRLAPVERGGGDEESDSANFPVPHFTPRGGWAVDRALLFAVMRQESGFDPYARSGAGAVGLMQVMPATARYIAKRSPLSVQRAEDLFDPSLGLAMGQWYVNHLLELPVVDGNLFYLLAAYNGGPGSLSKWLRANRHKEDPLLFIESIPSGETRAYIEAVMTSFWVYRDRFGQPSPSLDAVVAGRWPRYAPVDPVSTQVPLDAED